MSTLTVAELTDELRRRADLRGMTARHPDADLRRALTQSLRGLRVLVSRVSDVFIIGSTPTALPTAPPTTGELFLEVAWPSDAIAIYGVDVLDSAGCWRDLDPVRFASRRDYRPGGPPRAFVVRALPREDLAGSALQAGAIQIYPLSTQGQDYRIWYLPEFPELTSDHTSDPIQGFDGDWFEWVLWDATIKMCAEDDDCQNVDAIALRERAIVQDRITSSANRLQRAAPIAIRRARSEYAYR